MIIFQTDEGPWAKNPLNFADFKNDKYRKNHTYRNHEKATGSLKQTNKNVKNFEGKNKRHIPLKKEGEKMKTESWVLERNDGSKKTIKS